MSEDLPYKFLSTEVQRFSSSEMTQRKNLFCLISSKTITRKSVLRIKPAFHTTLQLSFDIFFAAINI
jgi:hypothetical protein